MGRLRTDEGRRLLRYLSERVEGPERLAEIEDALRDEDAEEFLREPDLLTYFPEQTVEIAAAGAKWQLRIIPHALLRMVQRGISQTGVAELFGRFVESYSTSEQVVVTGPYTIFGRTHGKLITLRADVDLALDESGEAHAVTVLVGRGDESETIAVGPV
jgi:hypothetical protein